VNVSLAYRRLLLAGYALLLVTLTHLPPRALSTIDIALWDKAKHAIAYALLALLVAWARPASVRTFGAAGATWCAIALFAAADEFTQPLVERSMEGFDWIADSLGAAAGLLVAALIMRRRA